MLCPAACKSLAVAGRKKGLLFFQMGTQKCCCNCTCCPSKLQQLLKTTLQKIMSLNKWKMMLTVNIQYLKGLNVADSSAILFMDKYTLLKDAWIQQGLLPRQEHTEVVDIGSLSTRSLPQIPPTSGLSPSNLQHFVSAKKKSFGPDKLKAP